ncbi:MAG: hypothetical protein IJL08_03415 [Oscillospiraceae bacterium]|nr:hypothetical protein [Oscillospiraceae bacterium]
MAEKKKRKGRRAYLNDFYTDVTGNTVYTGQMIRYAGEMPWRGAARRTGVLTGAVTACALIVFCLPAPSMTGMNKSYVVLPLILEAVGVLLTVWAAVRLLCNGPDLRSYVWEASAKKLPWWLEMTAVFAAVGVVGNVIYLAVKGFGGKVFLSLLVIVLHLLTIAAALFEIRFLRTVKWSGGEELPPAGKA